jgi:hypothetical protein
MSSSSPPNSLEFSSTDILHSIGSQTKEHVEKVMRDLLQKVADCRAELFAEQTLFNFSVQGESKERVLELLVQLHVAELNLGLAEKEANETAAAYNLLLTDGGIPLTQPTPSPPYIEKEKMEILAELGKHLDVQIHQVSCMRATNLIDDDDIVTAYTDSSSAATAMLFDEEEEEEIWHEAESHLQWPLVYKNNIADQNN